MNARAGIVALLTASLILTAGAQETSKSEPTPFQQRLAQAETPGGNSSPSVTGAFLRVIVALTVVLGVVVGLVYGLRRISPRFQNTSDGVVRVLAQVPLGPSQFLSVVDIAGTVVVLGVTDHTVTALSEVEDVAVVNRLRQNAERHETSFKHWLRRAQQSELER